MQESQSRLLGTSLATTLYSLHAYTLLTYGLSSSAR